MSDALTVLAIAAVTMTAVSVLLARVIPDEYDRMKPEPARVRRPGAGR